MAGTTVIVSTVENLSTTGAKPVEILLTIKFLWPKIRRNRLSGACGRRLRDPLRLIDAPGHIESTALQLLSDNNTRDGLPLRRNDRRAFVPD